LIRHLLSQLRRLDWQRSATTQPAIKTPLRVIARIGNQIDAAFIFARADFRKRVSLIAIRLGALRQLHARAE
jgi:hypothetical protein